MNFKIFQNKLIIPFDIKLDLEMPIPKAIFVKWKNPYDALCIFIPILS
jgi:hypothetical protein